MVSGPAAAYIFDPPSHAIRAVIGALGSAWLGPAAIQSLDRAWVAPGRDYAVALRQGQVWLISNLSSAQPVVSPLPATVAYPEAAVWSDDGSTVVLSSRRGNWIQTLTGLPGSVQATEAVSFDATGGALADVAVSARGDRVAVALTGTGAYLLGSSGLVQLFASQAPAALTFSGDANTLYVLDGLSSAVTEIHLADGSSATWDPGVDNAAAIRCARDANNRDVLYVAGRSSRMLALYDAATHERLAAQPLAFEPDRIQSLGTQGFLLRQRNRRGEILWACTTGTTPAIYFIPAGGEPARKVEQQ